MLRPSRADYPAGYTAVLVPTLTRDVVFDAIKNRKTYATTQSRIYLDATFGKTKKGHTLDITSASEEGIRDAAIILNGDDTRKLQPGSDSRIILSKNLPVSMGPGDFCYVRLTTEKNNMAWSSPFWA